MLVCIYGVESQEGRHVSMSHCLLVETYCHRRSRWSTGMEMDYGFSASGEVTEEQWKKGFLAPQVVAEMDSEEALASTRGSGVSLVRKARDGQSPGRTLSCTPTKQDFLSGRAVASGC